MHGGRVMDFGRTLFFGGGVREGVWADLVASFWGGMCWGSCTGAFGGALVRGERLAELLTQCVQSPARTLCVQSGGVGGTFFGGQMCTFRWLPA